MTQPYGEGVEQVDESGSVDVEVPDEGYEAAAAEEDAAPADDEPAGDGE